MNSSRRAITYIAMAFAVFLAAGIISAVGNAILAVAGIFDHFGGGGASVETMEFTKEFDGIDSLDIQNGLGELQIKTGDTFKVEAYNAPEDLVCEADSGTLKVKTKNHNWFGNWNKDQLIVVYLPQDFVAEKANIEGGAGKVLIDALQAEQLTIEGGAGLFEGDRITARKVKIDAGVGRFTLTQANLNDLDLSCGVGKAEISGAVTGKCKLDGGVGALDMTLTGNKTDYTFNVDNGVGSINVDGEHYRDGQRVNSEAKNSMEISGGVGSINIRFT